MRPESNGRTAANHNKLSQSSFCGTLKNPPPPPLFMHGRRCRRCERVGVSVSVGGFTAALHRSRSTADQPPQAATGCLTPPDQLCSGAWEPEEPSGEA